MADSRGIATKILRDMLNIGGERRVNPGEGTRCHVRNFHFRETRLKVIYSLFCLKFSDHRQ